MSFALWLTTKKALIVTEDQAEMERIESLTIDELRKELAAVGVTSVPLTRFTIPIYKKKLASLLGLTSSDEAAVPVTPEKKKVQVSLLSSVN